MPGPLPLGVAVIDWSIKLFGAVFPYVAQKHRSQLLAHFAECIRQAKSSRQQAIQTNILTAFLVSLKVVPVNFLKQIRNIPPISVLSSHL